MSETKPIKIKNTKPNKKHKVKIALYGLFVVMLVTLSLVLIFGHNSDQSSDDDYVVRNTTVISNSSNYDFYIKTNSESNNKTGKIYNLSNTKNYSTTQYAVITGVTPPTNTNSTTGIVTDYTLKFPEYVTDSNGVSYFVKEIDTTVEYDATNQKVAKLSYNYIVDYYINSFIKLSYSGSNNEEKTFYKHIKEIIVQDCVEYIEVGSFAGLGYVESMTLPFVGTQRGNFYNKDYNMGVDGYKSNFLSVFGYGPYLNGKNLDPSSTSNTASNLPYYFPSFDYGVSYYLGSNGSSIDSSNLIDPSNASSGSNSGSTTTAGATTSGTTTNNTLTPTPCPNPNGTTNLVVLASSVEYENYLVWYSDEKNSDLTMFYCPYYLRNVTITDEICVADRAFVDMSLLESLDISFSTDTSITSKYTNALTVGDWAFFRNYSLKTASLPSNANALSEGLYSSCHSLTSITLPDTLGIAGEIPESCFADCISLVSIILPSDIKVIGSKAFINCQSLSYIGSSSGGKASALSSYISLPQSLEVIENQAFRNCTSFVNVVVPDNVQTIGELAFNGCSSLTSITLPFIGNSRGSDDVASGSGLFGYIFGYYGYVGDGASLVGSGYSSLYQVKQNGYGHDSTGYTDYDSKSRTYFIPESLTNVVITSETKVAPGAFMNCAKIKNITIMSTAIMGTVDTKLTIAEGALFGCSGLTELSIPFVGYKDSISGGTLGHIFGQLDWSNVQNPTLKIARHLEKDTYWYVPANLTTIFITHQTTIRTNAFYKMHMIENLTIGDSTMKIERSILNGNTNLESLTLPFVGIQRGQLVEDYWDRYNDKYGTDYCWIDWHSSTYYVRNSLIWLFDPIGGYQDDITGFYENFSITTTWRYSSLVGRIPNALKNVTITNDTYIHSYAFRGFSSLNSITIEDNRYDLNGTEYGLIHIDSYCMYNCQNLTDLSVPFIGCEYNSAAKNSGHGYTIGWFFGSSGYTNSVLTRQGSTDYYIPRNLSRIYISGAESYVNQYAFQNMTNLTSVAFKGIINELGKYAFYNCKNLSTINWAYESGSKTGQDILATFTTVPDYCFYGCVTLGEMDRFIPDNVQKLGKHSFDSTNISYIPEYLLEDIIYMEDYVFNSCQQILEFDFTKVTNLLSVGDGVLANCSQLHTVILSKFLTNWMFMNDQSLQNINLSTYYTTPGARSDIPKGLFYGCTTLGNAVSTISSPKPIGFEFSNESITEIGAYAFADCVSLTNFILPESITKINSGAFQGCIRLEKMTINRNCLNLVMGTDNLGNDLIDRKEGTQFKADCGIFYGCNDDFYLEVYYATGKGPWAAGTWERNWNCYFPIYVIGTDTSTIFKFEYCEDLKGYLIVGFNTDDYTFIKTYATGYQEYLLEDILVFPDDYNGMPVKGILEGAFDNYKDDQGHSANYLAKVNTFVLGAEYIELGADVLKTDDRTVYIYSQMTAAQAQKYNSVTVDNPTFSPEYIGGSVNPNTNVISTYYGTSYGVEAKYASRAMVIYKDAWKWVGATPKVLLSAIHFDLEYESYTYDLGNKIVPTIVSITPNETTIHYTAKDITEKNNEDIILKEFYNFNTTKNIYDKSVIVGLDNILITYSNNVNVGTATIKFQSKLSNIYGTTTQYFSITQYELMLFNEANNSDLVLSNGLFGETTYSDLYQYYYYGLYGFNPSYVDSSGETQYFIREMVYHGVTWSNNQWTRGNQVLNLPEGYSMYGTLETVSKDVGHYESDKVNGNGNLTGSGFKWNGSVYIYNEKGQNVVGNFKLIITLYVEITPYVINPDNIRWDGTYNDNTSRYEYKYNGYVLSPKPYVYDSTWGKLDPEFVVEVIVSGSSCGNTGHNAIDPGDYGTMEITGWSSNFTLTSSVKLEHFEIVNGEIKIKIYDTRYTLDENNDYFYYNGSKTTSGLNSWTNTNDFHMEITGISDISRLYGSFITLQYNQAYLEKGTYTSEEYYDGLLNGDKYFWWDTTTLINGNPYEIISTERYTLDSEGKEIYLDESNKYNITLDITCEIQYSIIDYNISITEYPTYVDPNYELKYGNAEVRAIDDCVNVLDKNFSYSNISTINPLYILYGVDGYEHILSALIYNITNLNSVTTTILKGSQQNSQFVFKEITDASSTGYIELTLRIERKNYETVSKVIQLQLKQGVFKYGKLDKEYDREQVNVYSAFLNMPADLYTKYNQTFTWYKYQDGTWIDITGNATIIGSTIGAGLYGQLGPVDIGRYKVHIQIVNPNPTTYTAYFEDSDKEIEFTITPRSLIIDVSQTPYGKDYKEYDGLPWSYNPVGETSSVDVTTDINSTPTTVPYGLSLNLLSGDALTGNFYSYSSYPSTYTAENGDFYSYGNWYITNGTYGDQTNNYVLVFKGSFTITQLEFEYKIGADNVFDGGDKDGKTYSYNYDGSYHYATVKVTKPTSNYTVYYSQDNPQEGKNEDAEWSVYPYFYSEPCAGGLYYKTYIMIVSKDNVYKTVYDCVTIIIEGGQIILTVEEKDFIYDEFEHSLIVSTNPTWATVYYMEVGQGYDTSNVDPEDLSKFTTVAPSHTAIGMYYIVVLCVAKNYKTYYELVTMYIGLTGKSMTFDFNTYNGDYDREYHGFTLSNLSEQFETLTIKVAVDDGNKNWFDFTINETGVNTGIYEAELYQSAGTYPILVLVKKPGYTPYFSTNAEVIIKPIKLQIDADGYNGVYDGNYHTAMLKLASGSSDILYLNGKPVSYWSQDQIYEFILNDNLNYSYQTVIGGVDHYVDLTIEYGIIPSGANQIAWTTSVRKYINVLDTPVQLYYRVSGQDFETFGDVDTNGLQSVNITISKNENMDIKYKNIQIQYLARPLTYSDLGVESKHDGAITIIWRDRYAQNGVTQPGNIISAPQDLGEYIVYITYGETDNCKKKEIQFIVEIIPRILTVTYDKEYEFTGEYIIPVVTIDTGTQDVVQYSLQSYDELQSQVSNWFIYPSGTYPFNNYYFKLVDDTQNPNYELSASDAGFLPYKIINRTVYVDFDGDIEFTGDFIEIEQVYAGSYPTNVIDDLTISNLLSVDTLKFKLTTLSSRRSTYLLTSRYYYDSGSWVLHPTTPNVSNYFMVDYVDVFDTNSTTVNPYYEVMFNINLRIVNPPLEIEYDTPEELDFDGYYHSPTITIKSSFPGVVTWQFWEGEDTTLPTDPDDIMTTFPSYRNAGSYVINFIVCSTNFEPVQGQMVLIIHKSYLSTELYSYTAVYNAEKHQTSWSQLNNPLINLLSSEEPQIYYFPKAEVEALGYDINDIYDFFKDNCKDYLSGLYQFYYAACQRMIKSNSHDDYMIDAGDYYAILYAADDDSMQTNIKQVVQVNHCTIQKRTIWFDVDFEAGAIYPFIDFYVYDGKKKPDSGILFVGNGIFNCSYNAGYQPNSGLVVNYGHFFKDTSFSGYTFTTSSADARGNADGENNGDPYQAEGDFDFLYFFIYSPSEDVTKNYQPAFIPDGSTNVYPIQITIKRAEIDNFDVYDGEVVYSGKNIIPNHILDLPGNGWGEFETLYIPCQDDTYYWDPVAYPTAIPDCQDVGYYIVLIRILQGKNYNEWKGTGSTETSYYDGTRNIVWKNPNEAEYNGVWWRVAKVHCVPYNVQVQWEETECDYDGDLHYAVPYIIDVYGNRVNLHYNLYDTNRDLVYNQYSQVDRDGAMLNAGRYFVSADCEGNPIDIDGLHTITNANNYALFYNTVEFTINKFQVYLYYNESATWLHTNWSHQFTEEDEENVTGFKAAFPDYTLLLTVRTKSDYFGTFYDSFQFDIEAIVYDNSGVPLRNSQGYTFDFNSVYGVYNTNYYTSGTNVFDGCFYVADNFEFIICDGNFLVNIIEHGISHTAYDTDTEFDNQYHYPNISIKNQSGDSYIVQYKWGDWDEVTGQFVDQAAFDAMAWTATTPSFINVGVYKVHYQIILSGGAENLYMGELIIKITQAEAYLSIRNLDKVYDASPYSTSNINVNGGFNGDFLINGGTDDRFSLLQFEFYQVGNPIPLTSAPTDVGEYEVHITSQADGHVMYYQNYTELTTINNVYQFKITPATLTFNLQADLEVDLASDIIYDTKDPTSSNNYRDIILTGLPQPYTYTMVSGSTNIYVTNTMQITGLQGSDVFRYRIQSNTSNLGIGTFRFTNAIATAFGAYDFTTSTLNTWDFYDGSLFCLDWSTYYLDSGTEVHNNNNYLIKLVFTLNSHFPAIKVNPLPTEVYADYTGNAISFNQAFEAQEYELTGVTGRTILDYVDDSVLANLSTLSYSSSSSNNSSDYNLTDISQTDVGTYTIYFRIRCQGVLHGSTILNYDDYLGSIKFTIRQLDRTEDASWKFDSTILNKTYDADAYDSTTWKLFIPSTVTDFNPANFPAYKVILPQSIDPSSSLKDWTITYYVAKEHTAGDGDWYASGNELTSVVDAGDYMFKLVIPQYGIYAETVLMYHFKIQRRVYHIEYDNNSTSTYTTTYNTLNWQYDLVYNIDQNTSDFIVQTQNADEGLLVNNSAGAVNHQLSSALMVSSSAATGLYHQIEQYGDSGYLNMLPNYHVIIDKDGNDVTSNYEFIFSYALEIEKGNVVVGTSIADGAILPYGETISYNFEAWLITPSIYAKGEHIEYSTNYVSGNTNNVWTSDPPESYHKAGTYTVYVRVTDVQYYNDIGTDPGTNEPLKYTFTISKLQNTITIDDPSRPYNGAEISPVIHTLDYNGPVHSASDYYGSGVVITYYNDVDGTLGNATQITGTGRPVDAGTYWITVTVPDSTNYMGNSASLKFTIDRRTLSVVNYTSDYYYNATNIVPKYTVVTKDNGILFTAYSVDFYDGSTLLSNPPMNVGNNYNMRITPTDTLNYQFDLSSNQGTAVGPSTNYTLYYNINRCVVTITGSKNVDSTLGTTVTLTHTDLIINGFPASVTVSDFTIVTTFVADNSNLGTKSYQGDGLAASFFQYFDYNPTSNSCPYFHIGGVPENVIDNYDIWVDLSVVVGSKDLTYKITEYDDIYDGDYHGIQFQYGGVDYANLGSSTPGQTLLIKYSSSSVENADGSDYSFNIPQFKDFTNGMIEMTIAIKSSVYTNEQWIYLHYDSTATNSLEKLYVKIEKANTYISNATFDLSKVYDGQSVVNPTMAAGDFDIFTYSTDNLDVCVSYYYEVWDDSTSQWIAFADNNGPVDAGKYRLKISLDCSKASNQSICPECINYNDYTTGWFEFTIKQRKLVIKLPEVVKKYDGYVWSAYLDSTFSLGALANVKFEPFTGVTESGLVQGHTFAGYIETKTYLVQQYIGGHSVGLQAGDFVWDSQYEFKDSVGQTVPYSNYDVYVEASTHIVKNTLNITFSGYGTLPYTGNPYFLSHVWNVIPFIAGNADPDNYIYYSYNTLGFDSSNTDWSTNQTGTIIGQVAVFVRIDIPGYEVFEQEYVIDVQTLVSNVSPNDWGLLGHPEDIVYNGMYYNNDQLNVKLELSDPKDTRTPYLKYYYKNSAGDYICYTDNDPLSPYYNQYYPYEEGGGSTYNMYPLNAGEYAVSFCVDAANGYSAYESTLQTFTIKKRTVEVEWYAQYWDGNWPQMYYTGSPTHPEGYAYGVIQINTAPIEYERITLNYAASSTTYNLTSKGHQAVVASIASGYYPGHANSGIVTIAGNTTWHAAYIDNYELDSSKNCDYEIINGMPTPIPPDPVPPGGIVLESIKFEYKQYDPTASAASTPYEWSAQLGIYFQCTYTYSDSSTKVYYYLIDDIGPTDTGPMNLTINSVWTYDGTTWTQEQTNPTVIFDLQLTSQVTVPEFEVNAILQDKQNYAWDSNGDTNDQVIWVQLEPFVITDYVNEIKHITPTATSILLQYNGQTAIQTFYDQQSTDQKTYIVIKQGTAGLTADLTLEIHTPQATSTDPFELFYGRHAKASGDNANELAYYIIKSSDSYPIQFKFGDINLYNTYVSNHPTGSGVDAYDLANYTNVDSSFVPEFLFTIKSPEPTYIQLTATTLADTDGLRFVHYDQDISSDTLVFTNNVSNADRNTYCGTLVSDRKTSGYKLSHIAQLTTVDVLLTGNFVNNLALMKVISASGTTLFDGKTSTNNFDTSEYIGSGSYIELYADTGHTTLIDAVEIVVVGDTSGDGKFQTNDYTNVLNNVKQTYADNSCAYLAALFETKGKQTTKSYTTILNVVKKNPSTIIEQDGSW